MPQHFKTRVDARRKGSLFHVKQVNNAKRISPWGASFFPAAVGKCMCIVGNGPSAPQHAYDIDKCDYVVRLNTFKPGAAGHKWNVWWCMMNTVTRAAARDGLFAMPSRPDVLWTVNYSRAAKYPWGGRRPRILQIKAGRRAKMRRATGARCGASSGLLSIDCALRCRPARLVIVGMDARGHNDPGYDHWWGPMSRRDWHNFAKEKELLEEWVRTRVFCGEAFPDTEPVWWRMR